MWVRPAYSLKINEKDKRKDEIPPGNYVRKSDDLVMLIGLWEKEVTGRTRATLIWCTLSVVHRG